MKRLCAVLLLVLCSSCLFAAQNANVRVRVAAHRGDWRNYPENTLEAIESCIKMGVDIVEVDIAKTKDGHLLLMHDATVDRTTNGKGKVSDLTLAEIKQLRLRNGMGRITDFQIPTLEEVMLMTGNRVLINIDKGEDFFDDVYKVLEKTESVEQAIIKSDKPYEQLRLQYGEIMGRMTFMQIIVLKKGVTMDSIATLLDKEHPYYEICFQEENKELLLQIRDRLQTTRSVIWINSLWDSLCGGYSDDKALKDPSGTWGYLIDVLGAGILQTDRPALMLEYLRKRDMGYFYRD
jgi:glycerophosphoryl diester phosphodiesterase